MQRLKKVPLVLFILLPFFVNGQSGIITTVAGIGTVGYSGDNSGAITAKFDRPLNVKFDHSGNMYIVDVNNNVIRKVNTIGIVTTLVGKGSQGYSGDGGQASAAELYGPQDIAFDATGNLYISEAGNEVIRKVSPSGIITTIAGGGTSGLGDGGVATAADISDPVGLVFDNAGNLYFSDAAHYRIRKISTSGIITTVAGTGTGGNSGDGGLATNAKIKVTGYLAIDGSGDLLIPDWQNHCVRKINTTTGIITTIAGNGVNNDSGDGLPATDAAISSPESVIVDGSGNIYISNYTTCVIRKVNTSGIISTIVGNGTCGYGGDTGPATAAEINQETICSAIDKWGNLYIADSKNNRIRRITYNSVGVNEVKNEYLKNTLYPNPAHNELTISTGAEVESVEVVNIVGVVVVPATESNISNASSQITWLSNKEARLNISHLANGIYFVKVNGMYWGRFEKE